MKIKVCGILTLENGMDVAQAVPDLMGLIFYSGSPRYMRDSISPAEALSLPVGRVGVFVNASLEEVRRTSADYGLSYAQLHGDETPEYCQSLRTSGVSVVKVFSIRSADDMTRIENYEGAADYFLFDTKGEKRGGLGVKFDWTVLRAYEGGTPYFLSGGIGPDDIEELKSMNDNRLYAIDINSRFETAPGIKDVELVITFINKMRS